MLTASYFTYDGPGRIAITVGNPRRVPAGYRFDRSLAPTRDMFGLTPEEYIQRFLTILDQLDPQQKWDELHAKARGHEPVLQCFERPPFRRRPKGWCHRRIVADWFQHHLGHEIPELGHGVVPLWSDAPLPEEYPFK